MGEPTLLRIFISSPSDVAEERERARQVVEGLQRQFHSVILQAVLWEDLPLPATASFQQTIDYLLSTNPIDIAVFILWSRLGSPLGAASKKPDGTPYNSGTEREFDLMLEAFERSGRKRPIILAYTRNDDPSFFNRLSEHPTDTLQELIDQQKKAKQFIREQFQDEQGHNLRAYHIYGEPISFAQRLQVHLREIVNEQIGVEAASRWPEAPYRGLEFFDIKHAAIFHGRDPETGEVLQRLRDQEREGCAFVVILGASGSGKSSLARAGVAAMRIQHPYVDGIREWKAGLFVPGLAAESLLSHLVAVLTANIPELGATPDEQDALVAALAQDVALTIRISIRPAFVRAEKRVGGVVRLLLIVDQMEELWTDERFSASDREQFFNVLEALAGSGLIAVLATLRSDFYPHAQRVPAFLRLKGDRGQFDLLPPAPAALQRLIAEPGRLAGLQFESDKQTGRKLDEVIAEDAAKDPSALPLLEYALSELYERRDTEQQLLTFAAYEQLGRVEGALGRRASEQFQQLPEAVRQALPELLSLLVTIDTTGEQAAARRRASLADLTSTAERIALTESLVAARFLTVNYALVSLAHEALLREWKEVTDWIHTNRELLQLRSRVEHAEADWRQQHRDASLLLPSGLSLEAGRTLLKSGAFLLSADTRDYIERSSQADDDRTARERRVRRSRLIGLTCLTIAALLVAGYAWIKRQESASLAKDKADLALKWKLSADNANQLAGEKATLAREKELEAEKATALAAEKTQLAAAEETARKKATEETGKAQKLAKEKEQLAEREQTARKDAEQKTQDLQIAQNKIKEEFARAEAERARAETGRYQVQLARITYLGQDDPEQAMQLLQSSTDCPHELRDFTWSFLFAEALNFPEKKERVQELKPAAEVHVMAYAPHGRQLAMGHADGTITVWDTSQRQRVSTLRKHAGPVWSLAFSPSGQTLASGGEDTHVHVWDLTREDVLRTLTGHTAPVLALDFSTDGTLILSGSGVRDYVAAPEPNDLIDAPVKIEPGELILWSSETGARDPRPLPRGGVSAARFQPQTRSVVIGRTDETERFDLDRGESEVWPPVVDLQKFPGLPRFMVDCLAFASDGTRFCSVSHRMPTAKEKQASQQSRLTLHAASLQNQDRIEPPALPKGDFLLPDDGLNAPAPASAPPPVNDVAAPSLPEPRIPPFIPDVDAAPAPPLPPPSTQTFGHPRRIRCAAFSPDGRTLVTGDSEGHLQFRDPVTGGIRLTLRAHQGPVQSVAFSPDGSALASVAGGSSPKVVIHNTLPTEEKILADKIGWWSSARDLMQAGYDAGAQFGSATNVALAEVHLAESEAALMWAAGKRDLSVRKLAQAVQHAERYTEVLLFQGEMGFVTPTDIATAVQLLGRVRLAHYRATQASQDRVVTLIRVRGSRQPILWRITGGLPAGVASLQEQQILEEGVKASEATYLRAQLRHEVGIGSPLHAYESLARYNLARAASSWAKGDSVAAVNALQSAAMFIEWASPIKADRDNPLLMPAPANWNGLSEACDMQLALLAFQRSSAGAELRSGAGAELRSGFDEVIAHAKIELTGSASEEELKIFDETIRSLEEIDRISKLREEAGQLSPLDARLLRCRVLQTRSDRAWAAGQRPQAEQFLADAVTQVGEARVAADAMQEAGHPESYRIATEVIGKQIEVQLAHERIRRVVAKD